MTSAAPPTEFFPGINFNPSFYNLGQSAVTLDYLNSNFLRSTGYAISRAQFTLFNGTVDINDNLDVSGNINASAYLLNGVTFTPSQWTTSVNDIYYNTGNVGIGKTNPSASYKLDVSGNINAEGSINISSGNKYKINNANFAFSDLAGTLSYNSLTDKLTAGTNINIVSNAINNTYIYTLPTAGTGSGGTLGGVKVDGLTITINGSGVISGATTYTLPTAGTGSGGTLGGVKVDGSTITINSTTGIITATSATPYTLPIATNTILGGVKPDNTSIIVNSLTGLISLSGDNIILSNLANRDYGWGSTTSALGRAAVAGAYSTGSIIGDIVLRSAGNLRLQSGTTNPALVINTSNQTLINNSLGVATTSITSGFVLDVSGNIVTSGNINLANTSRSIYWGGTNSNLARAGVAGEYSSSAAINDIVLRSGNKLLLQSGTGAAAMVIDTANNVGIGITNPLSILHLHKNTLTTDIRIILSDNTSTASMTRGFHIIKGNDNITRLWNYENTAMIFATNTTERMIITNTGNVGIGTTPTSKLHILHSSTTSNADVGNIGLYLYNPTNAANNNSIICTRIAGTSASKALLSFDVNTSHGWSIYTQGNNSALRINSNWEGASGSDRLVIANNGVVSIGSINGSTNEIKLQVYSSDSTGTCAIFKHPNDTQGIGIRYNEIFGTNTNQDVNITTSGSGQIYFRTNGAERMRVYTDGSIRTPIGGAFIGNALFARAGGFDIRSICDSGGMYIEMGNEATFTGNYFRMGAYGSNTFIESNQNRNIYFRIHTGLFNSGASLQWRFSDFGDAFNAKNTTVWTQSSDQRIKENIVKADLKTCYENIKNINLYRFNLIDSFESASKDKNKLGYIAQEVKKYFPKATTREKRRLNDKREIPDLLTVDVEQINLSLYGAVKQLIKIIEKQNKRIKTLETLLNIEDNDEVENDAGEEYIKIYDEEECNIDEIEPTEPSTEV